MSGVPIMARLPVGVEAESGLNVVFFDGVCALCHASTRFLMRADRRGRLRFAPLQGETFAGLEPDLGLEEGIDSIVYVRRVGEGEPQVFVRSDAVLQALRDAAGPWAVVAAVARLVPRFLRDPLYDWIARHRYRWFGRYDACRLPDPDRRERLLP